jgi:hypothetical protein
VGTATKFYLFIVAENHGPSRHFVAETVFVQVFVFVIVNPFSSSVRPGSVLSPLAVVSCHETRLKIRKLQPSDLDASTTTIIGRKSRDTPVG